MSIQGAIEVDADAAVPSEMVRRVTEILQHEQVGHAFPGTPLHRVRIEAVLPEGMSLRAAHPNWLPEALPRIKTLPPFPAQPVDSILPSGIVRVAYEFVSAPSGGMSSHYGFRGHFVSLLI